MPTLKQYVNKSDKSGFYILANVGGSHPVTLQVTSVGEKILEKSGYNDGQNIPSKIVWSMHDIGIIYTDNTLDNQPDASESTVEIFSQMNVTNSLTREERNELISYLQDYSGPDKAQVRKLKTELQEQGISNNGPQSDATEEITATQAGEKSEDRAIENRQRRAEEQEHEFGEQSKRLTAEPDEEPSDKYWEWIKWHFYIPIILFISVIILGIIRDTPENFTFTSYPLYTSIFYILILVFVIGHISICYFISKDKSELDKYNDNIRTRHWLTLIVFTYLSNFTYLLFYPLARIIKDTSGSGAEPAGQTTTSSYQTGTLRIQLRDATGTPIEREVDVTIKPQSSSASNSQLISVSGGSETISMRQGHVQATAVVNGQQKQAKASVDSTESRITLEFDAQQLAVTAIDQSNSTQDPNPIAGVDITAEVGDDSEKQSYRGQTDNLGQWQQQVPLSASKIEITADHDQYEETTQTIAVENDKTQTDIQMRQLLGEIHATVTIGDESVSAVPIIAIREETGDAVVLDPDTNCSAVFTNAPVGSYTVKPDLSESPDEYSANEHNVAVTCGETRRVQLSISVPLNYLLSQGRQLVRDARDAQESDNLDAAIGLWEEADKKYVQAHDRASERDHSQVDNIEETRATIQEEIITARTIRAENSLKEALMSAWNDVLTGDSHLVGETPDPDRARDAYDQAIAEYETAIDHIQNDNLSIQIESADIETALTTVRDAQHDCDAVSILIRLEDALVDLTDDIENAPLSELTDILDECSVSEKSTELLSEQAITAIVYPYIETAQSELQRSQSLIRNGNYQEARSALSETETQVTAALNTVNQAPDAVTVPELQTVVTQAEQRVEEYQSAIDEILIDIDTDPSLSSVDESTLRQPTVSELPSYSEICRTAPVESALWQTVGAEFRSEYDALSALLATVHDSGFSRWVSGEYNERITAHQNAIETIDPITAGEELLDRHEEIITDCREIVAALVNRLQSDRRTLEEASLPEELAYQRDRIDEISSESLSEIDDIERFTEEWSMMVSQLNDRLESIADTVSVVESDEMVADLIMKALTDDGTVTPDELPISSAEKALRIYAYQHSNVTFDSRESTLRRR